MTGTAAQLGIPIPKRRRRRNSDEGTGGALIITVGRRSMWLRGRGAIYLLDQLGSQRMWCPFRHELTAPIDALDDLLALAEHRHRGVVLREARSAQTGGGSS
jgi:hypothetical protein